MGQVGRRRTRIRLDNERRCIVDRLVASRRIAVSESSDISQEDNFEKREEH